jgi:hypothetical protein
VRGGGTLATLGVAQRWSGRFNVAAHAGERWQRLPLLGYPKEEDRWPGRLCQKAKALLGTNGQSN